MNDSYFQIRMKNLLLLHLHRSRKILMIYIQAIQLFNTKEKE